MANGLAWLNDLMTWLAKWVPRLALVKAGNHGVMYGPNGAIVGKAPGMCLYWPITHQLEIVSTRARSAEIAAQLHGSEAISLVVLFIIKDPVSALLNCNDVFSQLDDRTQAHLSRSYRPDASNQDLGLMVRDGLRDEFTLMGIDIMRVDVAQRGWILPIKMLSDYAQHSAATL